MLLHYRYEKVVALTRSGTGKSKHVANVQHWIYTLI